MHAVLGINGAWYFMLSFALVSGNVETFALTFVKLTII